MSGRHLREHRFSGLRRLIAIPLVFMLASSAAWGYWTAGSLSGGNGFSSIASFNAAAAPTTTVSGKSVTVNWVAVALNNGTPVTKYEVNRYSGTTKQTITGACSGAITGVTCTETPVPVGTWTYTVTPVFATFWRGAESANSASVTIVNMAPTGTADAYSVNEDAALTVAPLGVLSNDTDPENTTLTAVLVTGVANGTVSLSSNGGFTYTPRADFNGTDSFTYRAFDGALNSNTVTVSLTVTAVNDAPVNRVPGTQETATGTSRVFSSSNNNLIAINDVDAGTTDSMQVALTSTNGTITLSTRNALTFSAGDGTTDTTMIFTGTIANINTALSGLTFAPTSGFSGVATLKLVMSDQGNSGSGGTLTDTDTISINVNAYGIFTSNQNIGSTIARSSSYTSGSTIPYSVTSGPGDIWNQADVFQYLYRPLTTDGRLTARVVSQSSNNATAKGGVMIRQSIDAGSVHASVKLQRTNGTEFTWRTPANTSTQYYGTNAAPLPYYIRITRVGTTITPQKSSDGINWFAEGAAIQLTAQNLSSSALIGLVVASADGNNNTATFSNVLLQTPPSPAADDYSLNEDGALTVSATDGLLANDRDTESNPLTTTLVAGSGPSDGTLLLNSDGSFTYTPASNASGTRMFTYTATNGAFTTAATTVILTIRPANETPSFSKGADQTVLINASAQSVAAWATNISAGSGESTQLVNFTTSNTNNALFSAQPAVSPTGTLSFTPKSGASGTSTVTVSIRDNGGTANGGSDTSADQTFTISLGDTAGPTGGSITPTSLKGTNTRYSAAAVDLTLAKGSDPSGVAASGARLLRAFGTLTSTSSADGVCATLGDYAPLGNLDPAAAYTDTVTATGCYSYQYIVKDTLGNATTYTITNPVKVDLSAPSAPPAGGFSAMSNAYWPGASVVYYNPNVAGSFIATASGSVDDQSGITGYTYPALGGTFSSMIIGATNKYSWTATSTPSALGAVSVTSNNNAAMASATGTSFTATYDNTPPSTGAFTTSPAGATTSTSIALNFASGSDSGSGINTSTRALQRAQASLVSGVCQTFSSYTSIGTANPSTGYSDAVTKGYCYRYQYVVTDNVGNSRATLATTADVKVGGTSTYSAVIMATGNLSDYLRLGETSGLSMANGSSGNTGTYYNSPTLGVAGAINYDTNSAVSFDGINDYGLLNRIIKNNFSIEFWFKSTVTSASGCFQWYEGKGLVDAERTGSGGDFGISLCGGKVYAGVGSNAAGTIADRSVASPASTYTDGNWHQVVFTRDKNDGDFFLYVDGYLVASDTSSSTDSLSVTQLTIGNVNGTSSYFSGTLDEISYYNTVLTASQISAHYRAGLG